MKRKVTEEQRKIIQYFLQFPEDEKEQTKLNVAYIKKFNSNFNEIEDIVVVLAQRWINAKESVIDVSDVLKSYPDKKNQFFKFTNKGYGDLVFHGQIQILEPFFYELLKICMEEYKELKTSSSKAV